MRDALVKVYVHFVWATWDRLPLLTHPHRAAIHACIQSECVAQKAAMLAVGGTDDHVHLLVQLPATVAVADFVKHLKGASSHLANQRLGMDGVFKWQGAYGAFSVSASYISLIRNYIAVQEQHHQLQTLRPELELPS